jgi:hypothetical protein
MLIQFFTFNFYTNVVEFFCFGLFDIWKKVSLIRGNQGGKKNTSVFFSNFIRATQVSFLLRPPLTPILYQLPHPLST